MNQDVAVGLVTIGTEADLAKDRRACHRMRGKLFGVAAGSPRYRLYPIHIGVTDFYERVGHLARRAGGDTDLFLASVEQFTLGFFQGKALTHVVYSQHLGSSDPADWLHPPFANAEWISLLEVTDKAGRADEALGTST